MVCPPVNNNLPSKARVLRAKFQKCSTEEQLKFFENIVKQNLELKAYKEELANIREGSL